MDKVSKNGYLIDVNDTNGHSFTGYVVNAFFNRYTSHVTKKQKQSFCVNYLQCIGFLCGACSEPLFSNRLRIIILSRTCVHGKINERLVVRWRMTNCQTASLVSCEVISGGWFMSSLDIENIGWFARIKMLLRRLVCKITSSYDPLNSVFRVASVKGEQGRCIQTGFFKEISPLRILLLHQREISLPGNMFVISDQQTCEYERSAILESSQQICHDLILSHATIVKLDVLELGPYCP